MSSARLVRATLVLALAAGSASAQSGAWAITNARIETVTRGSVERGTIVIRNGVIEAVGANVAVPADARIVDATGRTIYPGLFDLTSGLGLPAPARPAGPGGGGGNPLLAANAAQNEPQGPFGLEPGRLVANEIKLTEADITSARNSGLTAILIAPSRGPFRGLSALVPLRGDTATRWIVKSPVALHMGFQSVQGRYPGSLLGVIAYQRQALYDAQRHAQIVERYKANPAGMPRASYDADLDALVPVVKGEMPIFFAANSENELRRALAIGGEFKLAVSVVGATEAFRALDALKGARLSVVSVDYPNPTQTTGWEYRGAQRVALDDSTTRSAAVQKLLEGNAAALNGAGIRFALASGGLRPDQFMTNVKKAIAAGLPRATAIEALTIRAAEAAGVEKQLGSIEVGKIANLVLVEGELLTDAGTIRSVFVDGDQYSVVPVPRPAGATPNGPRRPPMENR